MADDDDDDDDDRCRALEILAARGRKPLLREITERSSLTEGRTCQSRRVSEKRRMRVSE